jgi:L-threonylcarbamoyladenylate synthase
MLSAAQARRVRAHLKAGGVIAYATESCFGFGCDPFNYRAVRRVLRIKQRPQQKGLIVIGANLPQLEALMDNLSPQLRARAQTKWPGAHTWLVPASARVPAWLRGRHARVALRVPAHRGARELCAQTNSPLVSTSANRSSHVSIKSYKECVRQFGRSALVIQGRIGRRKRPSTIADLTSGKVIRG